MNQALTELAQIVLLVCIFALLRKTMISISNRMVRWAGALVLAGASSFASAAPVCDGNIVSNCGFEGVHPVTDELTAWTLSNGNVARVVDNATGEVFLRGSGDGGSGDASQSIELDGMTSYAVDFWLDYDPNDGPIGGPIGLDGRFSWSIDGVVQPIKLGAMVGNWQQVTGMIAAMPNDYSVDLMFSFVDTHLIDTRSSEIFLDYVNFVGQPSSISVPEPGSLLLVGIALAAGAVVRRRKIK